MREYLKKQLKIRDENLKYDFLPSMVEIIERPASKLANIILFLVIGLIVTAILWAALFRIDIAVTAVGSIMPEGGMITLNSMYGGKVSELYVEDGSFVEEGGLILSLDSTEAELSVIECKYNLEVLEVQREIYGNIYEGLCTGFGFDIVTSIYGDYAFIADAILIENQVYEETIDSLSNSIQKEKYKQEYMLTILQSINTLDVKIYSAQISLQKAEEQVDNLTIKAPTSGQWTQMTMFTKGTLITAGDTVGYLLPEDTVNCFTAYVSDADIGQIHVDDVVSVKIAAYKDTKYEYLDGRIVSIGDIALNIDGIGAAYIVEIQLMEVPENIKVGMEGGCDIIIGTRTVLDYFLDPFKEGLDNSLKER